MAAIDISSTAAPLNDGVLQLQNGVAMDSTLRNVADQNDTTSPLKLSTTAVQVVSPLRITTDDPSDFYLDCEDGSANNRFSITRNTASQQVNLNFASNPAGSTTIVGAIRTYVDGVNLSEVMAFREDGNVGIGTNTPIYKADIGGTLRVTDGSFALTYVGNAQNGSLVNAGTYPSFKVTNAAGVTRGIFGSGGPNGYLELQENGTTYTYLTGTATGNAGYSYFLSQLGVGTATTLGAKLGIKGSGSTSATTALLVQNSGGGDLLKIRDDGFTIIGAGNQGITSANATFSSYIVSNGTSGNVFGTFTSFISSAIVQCDSTSRGFLPPRMTTAQKNAIATPAAGLMIYDTTLNKLCVYTTAWETITSV